MTNEMKLLAALCDALGFDVERVCVNQDDIELSAKRTREALARSCNPWNGGLAYAEIPAAYRLAPIYEYKLTKRECFSDDQVEALRQSRIHATMYKEKLL